MNDQPVFSYIVRSYNCERFISTTLRSILDQTAQDFEILVVDDCSRDSAIDVIRRFDDHRIHLLVNDQIVGDAECYNRAVQAARGEWLVYLAAGDRIAPRRADVQLAAAVANPRLDIVGTYISAVAEDGTPHPLAADIESRTNQPYELGHVDTWIGANRLCRSSTMIRRSAQKRIGMDDSNMTWAADYELWTRALREGCVFAVIPEQLTFVRQRPSELSDVDPRGMLLEMSYAMLRNLLPLADARALHPSVERIVTWVAQHPELATLGPTEAYRMVGMAMTSPSCFDDFADFCSALSAPDGDATLERAGRRCLSMVGEGSSRHLLTGKLEKDVQAFIEARDYWHARSSKLEEDIQACTDARDYWHGQSDQWELLYRSAATPVPRLSRPAALKSLLRNYLRVFRSRQ